MLPASVEELWTFGTKSPPEPPSPPQKKERFVDRLGVGNPVVVDDARTIQRRAHCEPPVRLGLLDIFGS